MTKHAFAKVAMVFLLAGCGTITEVTLQDAQDDAGAAGTGGAVPTPTPGAGGAGGASGEAGGGSGGAPPVGGTSGTAGVTGAAGTTVISDCPAGCPDGAKCGIDATCVCLNPRQLICGWACIDVATSGSNCGSCGNACGSGHACTNGVCQ